MDAVPARKPLQPHEPVPTTPGRIALLFACAGLMTFGVLSPIALLVSLIAVVRKPDWFGAAALLLSGAAVAVLVDIIFFGGFLLLLIYSVFA
ncbi:MAG: hypothetical protein NCW75_01905 [Phycisphaera sp.]|nr:MAG: hypothetical protein NCW75_01905 [Phycisphaera sp.]